MKRNWMYGMGLAIALSAGATGCASQAGSGALLGGAAGAGLGAIIGHNSHDRATEGALLGGAIGALGGGLIGNEADKNDRARSYDRYDEDYYDRRPPPPRRRYERYDDHYGGDGYYEYRSYRSYGPGRRSSYYESRRY